MRALDDARDRADHIRLGVIANFLTALDEDDAKGQVLRQALADHQAVAIFENMEWQHLPRKQHRV